MFTFWPHFSHYLDQIYNLLMCQHKRNIGGIDFFFYLKKVRGTRGTGVFLDYKCWY